MGLLPRKITESSLDLMDYSIMLIGDKKTGKTRFVSFIPGVLIYALEPASRGRPMYKVKPKNWKEVLASIDELEQMPANDFPAVAFDTIDVLWQMCCDRVVQKLGIERLGLTIRGKRDYGYSHGIAKQELLSVFLRITRTGRTLVLVSHTKLRTITTIEGEEYQKVMPSVPPSCLEVIKPLTDMNFMLDFARVDDKKQHVILTQGDSRYFAGCGDPSVFPDIIPLLHCFNKKTKSDVPEEYEGVMYDSPWELVCKAFTGDVPGIDPERVTISLESGAISSDVIEELSSSRKEAERKKAHKPGEKSPKRPGKVPSRRKHVARRRT